MCPFSSRLRIPVPIAVLTSAVVACLGGGVALAFGEGSAGPSPVPVRAAAAAPDPQPSAAPPVAPVAPAVTLVELSDGPTIERGLCVTVAVAGGAMECGDLRTAYALPAFRSLNRVRAPVLLYNSGHAVPQPTVYADVQLPAGGDVPVSVTARIVLATGATGGTASFPGSQWTPGATRRIAVRCTSCAGTAAFRYTLQVTNQYAGSSLVKADSGELVVVDRSQSPFGAGWWLAGWERLVQAGTSASGAPRMLWVGGDGSARTYEPLFSGAVVSAGAKWEALTPTRGRDTLVWDGTHYTRTLPGRVRIRFDAGGVHVQTENRLGHVTTFTPHASGGVAAISVPTAGAAGSPGWTFTYGGPSSSLSQVTASVTGAPARVVALAHGHGDRRVTGIRGPDMRWSQFGYSGASPRLASRTDRRGTTVSYTYDAAGHLNATRLPLAPGDTIITNFQAGESRGVGTSEAPGSVLTRVAGPRADVMDNTEFWLTRWGAPSLIQDALGNRTYLYRQEPSLPALVTRVDAPNGFRRRAAYNARGSILRVTAENARGDGVTDTTRYVYGNATWPDFATRIVPPERDSVVITYDADGNRSSQRDALGRTVHFRYYTAGPHRGMLRATDMPETPADSVRYDGALGNLSGTRSPMGVWTNYYTDALGQVYRVRTPIDGTHYQDEYTYHDVMGRDTLIRTTGPALPYSLAGAPPGAPAVGAESTHVRKGYDEEGNVVWVTSWSTPDAGVDPSSSYVYDAAGRKVWEAVGPKVTTYVYDHAGNVVTTYNGRNLPTHMTYDAANRMVSRVMPSVAYPAETCGQHGLLFPCQFRFPLYPNDGADGLVVGGDTATFTYDFAGNLLTANNRAARIRRTYTPGGLLATDTLRIREYGEHGTGPTCPLCPGEIESLPGGDPASASISSITDPYPAAEFGLHVYGLRYRYDRNGRLRALLGLGTDSTHYAYDVAGQLTQVRDPGGNLFGFGYDDDGRPIQTDFPGPLVENRTYDDDGRMVRRRTDGGWLVADDSITYDLRGKALRVREADGNVIENRYSGLGTLLASSRGTVGAIPTIEEYRSDPLGHTFWSRTRDPETGRAPVMEYEYVLGGSAVGRIASVEQAGSAFQWDPDTTYTRLDAAGNVGASGNRRYDGTSTAQGVQRDLVARSAVQNYYSADDRLRYLQKYDWSADGGYRGTFDEYRYDALGRRVLQRMRRDSLCTNDCTSAIERYVWSGDQLLYEFRAPAGDNATAAHMATDNGSGREFGRIGYTHAAGIDAPLSVIRRGGPYGDVTLISHSDYRGAYHAASLPSGGAYTCMPAQPCLYVVWPKKHWGAYFGGGDPASGDWAGSLIRGNQDVSGLMYRRNRYYDPATGQFTQSDPIGIAGGLNTYGFAAGDPISFSDPFGLKADTSFTGAENGAVARAAWHQMRAEAEAAAASGDNGRAAAGTMMLTMMELVENSPVMYEIDVADQGSTFRLLFQGHEACPEANRCRITLDHTQQTDQSMTVRLAHELGGAFLGRSFGMRHNTGAMIGENMARSMNGCRRRGGHNPFEYPGGPC